MNDHLPRYMTRPSVSRRERKSSRHAPAHTRPPLTLWRSRGPTPSLRSAQMLAASAQPFPTRMSPSRAHCSLRTCHLTSELGRGMRACLTRNSRLAPLTESTGAGIRRWLPRARCCDVASRARARWFARSRERAGRRAGARGAVL